MDDEFEQGNPEVDPALAAARRDQIALDAVLQELEDLKKEHEENTR